MQFGLSDEQQMIVAMVRRFVESERFLEDAIEASGRLDPPTAKASREISARFHAMNIPEQYVAAAPLPVDTMLPIARPPRRS
jgi:alkylation response protein AidB-like acyl-CoA dehydrogenase